MLNLKQRIMKKLTLLIGVLFLFQASFSQIFSWGFKGGVNSSKISFSDFSIDQPPTVSVDPANLTQPDFLIDVNGTTVINPDYITVNAPKVSFTPSSYAMGFHFGAFARVKIAAIFLQPELIFSQTNANIDMTPSNFDPATVANQIRNSQVTYNNFDVPVMLGFKFGPAHICAGPVASFKLSSKLDAATKQLLTDMQSETDMDVFTVTKNATFGAQVGTGLTIAKKVTLDVRYEFGLSRLGDAVTIKGHEFKTDQRQSQVIGSLGIMF